MRCSFNNLKIQAITVSLPVKALNLHSLAGLYGEKEVERIIESTGIDSIRVAEQGITASDLCTSAGRHLLEVAGVAAADVDGLIMVTQTPDYIMPATSMLVQKSLSLSSATACFDFPYGCSGYIYGLFQAALLIQSGACQQVLVCAGDTITQHVHALDRSIRMVFGDAGSATLVTRGDTAMHFAMYADGGGAQELIIPAGGCRLPRTADTKAEIKDADGNVRTKEHLYMNGADIMRFALDQVPKVINEVLGMAGWEKQDVGLYALHQANQFMINYLAKVSRLPKSAVPLRVNGIGNTGPSSIPVLLSLCGDEFNPAVRQKSVMCGFGVGLSWGACTVDLQQTKFIPPVEYAGA